MDNKDITPRELGYRMPAEWEKQKAVYLSWPLNPETWTGVRPEMEKEYAAFAAALSRHISLRISCVKTASEQVLGLLSRSDADLSNVRLLDIPTNDAWCRDHGPTFLLSPDGSSGAVHFRYNAWGAKFSPWDLDDAVSARLADVFGFPLFFSNLTCEGGALETNGAGVLLTTRNVVLNPNRNPGLSQAEAERLLRDALGVDRILWLESGLLGDDTDGHADTLARFIRKDAVLAAVDRKGGIQYDALDRNFRDLAAMRLDNGEKLEVIPLPCPEPVYSPRGDLLPATYANFLPVNEAVFVPVFGQDRADERALEIIGSAYPDRTIVPLSCRYILIEGGALHCLSQQEYEGK